jgi:hypothetical protein
MSSMPLRGGNISFENNDDYETTEEIWKMVYPYMKNFDSLYEPFYCSGKSGEILKSFGFNVIHQDEDFFTNYMRHDYDLIVSNPPFSIKKKVFDVLHKINKPFIMISPVSIITKLFFREKYEDEDITILIPQRRLQFSKKGEDLKRNWFDCIFVCYNLGLEKQIIFL